MSDPNRLHTVDLGISPPLTILGNLDNGAEVLHRKPYSLHPSDNFLEIVLAYLPAKGEFAVWLVNLQTGGASHGAYLCPRDFPIVRARYLTALRHYDDRGVETHLADNYDNILLALDDCPCSPPGVECTPECVACHEDAEAEGWQLRQ